MKVGLATVSYHENRFLGKFLSHIPSWVDSTIVLNSSKPWHGEPLEGEDKTQAIGNRHNAITVINDWSTEEAQRNTGQSLHEDKDWVIWLDPDEFLSDANWDRLREFLETTQADAAICEHQRVFWKDKEVYPHSDYQQLIAARPHVKFVDKRVVNTAYEVAPVELLHFSWARTDKEVWDKISHYAHAKDFDINKWYNEVWLGNKTENLHPVTPETLKSLIDPQLPAEIEGLDLWPPK